MDVKYKKLSELRVGERGAVGEIALGREVRERIFDLGLAPGEEIVCVGESPLGNPRAYLVLDSIFAIRNFDAARILVESIEPD